MPRPRAILQSECPYNVSARCINRDWFDVPIEHVWAILCEELYMATILHDLRIHSFVLMANHFHLIATTPQANISAIMKRFMEMTSKRLGEKSGRINQCWGARHFKSLLTADAYYLNAYKYNYLNPVRAGIAERCEDYRYSTLSALLGKEKVLVPLEEDNLLFPDHERALDWLNCLPPKAHLDAIQIALRKPKFDHAMCPISRRPILGPDHVI